jgi:hypothetical protein
MFQKLTPTVLPVITLTLMLGTAMLLRLGLVLGYVR